MHINYKVPGMHNTTLGYVFTQVICKPKTKIQKVGIVCGNNPRTQILLHTKIGMH
jgi:hypothetical protein